MLTTGTHKAALIIAAIAPIILFMPALTSDNSDPFRLSLPTSGREIEVDTLIVAGFAGGKAIAVFLMAIICVIAFGRFLGALILSALALLSSMVLGADLAGVQGGFGLKFSLGFGSIFAVLFCATLVVLSSVLLAQKRRVQREAAAWQAYYAAQTGLPVPEVPASPGLISPVSFRRVPRQGSATALPDLGSQAGFPLNPEPPQQGAYPPPSVQQRYPDAPQNPLQNEPR